MSKAPHPVYYLPGHLPGLLARGAPVWHPAFGSGAVTAIRDGRFAQVGWDSPDGEISTTEFLTDLVLDMDVPLGGVFFAWWWHALDADTQKIAIGRLAATADEIAQGAAALTAACTRGVWDTGGCDVVHRVARSAASLVLPGKEAT